MYAIICGIVIYILWGYYLYKEFRYVERETQMHRLNHKFYEKKIKQLKHEIDDRSKTGT